MNKPCCILVFLFLTIIFLLLVYSIIALNKFKKEYTNYFYNIQVQLNNIKQFLD